MQFSEKEFKEYREANKDQRFWQCLRNYMEVKAIWLEVSDSQLRDTFNIEDERS